MNALMMTLQQPLNMAALAHCLGWGADRKTRVLKRRRARPAAEALPALPALDGDDEAAHPGCGWFDSSHELHQGLEVLEHSCTEAWAQELPVTVWLQLALHGAATKQGMIQP